MKIVEVINVLVFLLVTISITTIPFALIYLLVSWLFT